MKKERVNRKLRESIDRSSSIRSVRLRLSFTPLRFPDCRFWTKRDATNIRSVSLGPFPHFRGTLASLTCTLLLPAYLQGPLCLLSRSKNQGRVESQGTMTQPRWFVSLTLLLNSAPRHAAQAATIVNTYLFLTVVCSCIRHTMDNGKHSTICLHMYRLI